MIGRVRPMSRLRWGIAVALLCAGCEIEFKSFQGCVDSCSKLAPEAQVRCVGLCERVSP